MVVFLFGNPWRGMNLMISGLNCIAARYVVTLVFVLLFRKRDPASSSK